MQSIHTTLPVGSVLQNRYIIERLLGKGGFGAVYLVKDRRVRGNLFALKEVVDPDKKERQRFTFEGNLLAKLDHPALPRVYRTFEDDTSGRAYMLMDYVEGPNLEVLRQKQPDKRFTLARTLQIMEPVVSAVSYLHQQDPPIVHRDIKPSNIIVPENNDEAVLVDFGIAKEYDMESTTTAIRRCSPGYGAPEQYAKGTNPRTDTYGLAATFYVLLTGQVPTDALYRMTRLGSKHPDPLVPVSELVPEIPLPVSNAIAQALAINSNERFATVDEFWQALRDTPIDEVPTIQPAAIASTTQDVAEASTQLPVPAVAPRSEKIPFAIKKEQTRSRRRALLWPVLIVVALLALIGGVAYGSGLFSLSLKQANHATTPIVAHKSARPTTISTTKPTTIPASKPTAKPTTQPANTPVSSYPTLAGLYNGTINDRLTTPPTSSSMTLSSVQQSGANVNGNLVLGNGLQGDGPFNGTVSQNKAIQFTVPGLYGHLPLLFQGRIQANGSMSGTYCSYRGNYQCDNQAGGYGDWNVSPPAGQS